MDLIAGVLVPTGRMALGYADLLVRDVAPEMFARKPKGIDTNTPAFCFGHLAIYPEMMLETIGRSDLAIDPGAYRDLFGAGQECRDDPDGTIYPSMESIMARFRERHAVAFDAIARTPDEVMLRENPREGRRERFPTAGAALGFYLGGHIFTHLGQVSAWRRCMGLRSAM